MGGTVGILVAGGAGRRLGLDRPKALVEVGGETLIDRAARTLSVFCDEVIVAGPGAVVPAHRTLARRVRRVDDRPGVAGPLAGMVAALAAASFQHAVVLGVDFPFMRVSMLLQLRSLLGGHDAVVPHPGGIPQPLAAVYAPAALPILAAAHDAGEAGPTRASMTLRMRRVDDLELEAMPGGLDCFFNLNTPRDLAEAGRRLAAQARAAT